ncbi:OstA-like protein [Pedobacter flavus]|uniref:OstA-like protein n=1 Tax=Pedobacter flavus TaxID=3113906 RepID=A0ABU7GYJ1_9SPHI|nr:OstA-like protein [Pedobacter sp. VNH31]MEE1884076.1 OstA-like protein [Pedobacter sp. VNH31]
MYKLIIFISCLFFPLIAASQKKTVIILEGAEKINYIQNSEAAFLRKPIFRHDNAILTCDSAVFYGGEKNYFEAFGKVHINQADSVNIYSERLTYDGNNKIAHLSQNVRMLHRDAVLTTQFFDYRMAPKVGNYWDKGKIVAKDVTVNSKTGYYFANSRDAYFRYNVVAVTNQSTIKSDTLRFNVLKNLAYFYGPTNIIGKDDNLYTENGIYNTQTGDAVFGKNNLYTNGSKSLTGDSLFYYGEKGYGRAVKNIVFRDTKDKILFKGDLGEYFKSDEKVLVTKNAYFGISTEDSVLVNDVKIPDTLWTRADTLSSLMVLKSSIKSIYPKNPEIKNLESYNLQKIENKTSNELPLNQTTSKSNNGKLGIVAPSNKEDSLKLDTVKSRIIVAYPNVKVYKSNLQAKADSLFYSDADSTIRWYKNPIIWAENSQQTGDTIYLLMRNKKLHKTETFGNGFIVNVEGDSTNFNQIKGSRITGNFIEGEINNINVVGNAETIYFNREKGKIKDMHQSFAGSIRFEFKDKALSSIEWSDQSEGKLTPVENIKGENILTGFIWKPELRPQSKQDIIGKKLEPKLVVKEKPKK